MAISFFRERVSNPTSPKDTDPTLSLGDSFTLDSFPKKGESMVVRVVKMATLNNFSKGKPTTIQYYLEPYCNE